MPETFHRRGHHVQKAHGRRITLASDNSHTSGGMIALMPTADDAKRLALPGGETAVELHCTLFFLGEDGSVWTEEQRDTLEGMVRQHTAGFGPVQAKIFGVAHWNGGGDRPSWVWSVGDDPDHEEGAPHLGEMRVIAGTALSMTPDLPEVPEQHTPWAAHVCAAYTDDLTLVRRLEKGLGPVTFDRVRLSFGDDDRDIPLTGALTASALRREPLAHEEHTDFAEHNRQWENAVAAADSRMTGVYSAWRERIKAQVSSLADEPDDLTALTLDSDQATEVLHDAMLVLARQAGDALVREAGRQGIDVPEWSLPDDTVTAAVGGRRLLRSVAQMSADLLATSVVQMAKRVVTGLFARDAAPGQIATEVDRALADAQDGILKGQVGTAMSTAQTAGRQAVLEAAPPGEYYASEMLDKNTCGPCKAVDGEQFGSLEIAVKAYPVMGYKDCVGPRYGNSCRGMIVARWTPEGAEPVTAGIRPPEAGEKTSDTLRPDDQPEEGHVTTEALRKGKPSKGTKKDKRLAENQYAEPGHFHPHDDVAMAWNGAASRFSDTEYKRACAACDSGGTPKESCFLPHHEPDGGLNADGVHAAAQRFSSLSGHSPEAVARAKAHLRGHYRTLGEKPPDVIAATQDEIDTFGTEDGYESIEFESTCPPGTKRMPDGNCRKSQKKRPGQLEDDDMETLNKDDCPPGMTLDKETGECMKVEQMAGRSEYGAVDGADDSTDTETAPWRGPLTVEGVETGDGREFDSGSLVWADLPLPLRWNRVDSHGGETRTEAVNVGRIDRIWREDSGLIMGEGVLDLSDDDGRKVHGKIKGKHLRGVSVDVDSIKDADMELIWPEPNPDGEDPADDFAKLFASPEKIVFHKGRIRAATLVDIPAFAEAYIALLDGEGAVVAGGEPIGALRVSAAPRPAVRMDVPAAPPADWFRNPDLSVPTGITVSPEGRVYGHAALWGTCHIGQAGVCVTPPQESDHPYFMTGSVLLAEGSMASVGQITLGTGHAPLDYGHRAASEHYDNTGVAVADVAVGNDAHGIWVAGSVRPGTTPERIHELRASGQVSGDWRNIGGKLRLVGLLAVNVPGFPVPKLKTKLTSGRQLALVAAGIPDLHETMTEEDLDQWAYRRVLTKLALRVHGKE